jgi:glycosyltransferase involved in cell wall biosynthesis
VNLLSIIIPCFNCAQTLGSAVASIYQQDVPIPFDVTMVDDGSTDDTWDVMRRIAGEHANIKILQHAVNRGGGAARNTAVAHSTGNLIFCLDSDDMLGPNFLPTITGFWLQKRCDGVGISTSVKFNKSDISDVAYVDEFAEPGRRVRLDALLDGSACSLFSTFLITRRAFARAGGYPTSHGFDTQGMAFRFLCNGLTAYTCPGTVYYHRVHFHDSYYLREQTAERINWNWFQVFEEFLYLFRAPVREAILSSDLYAAPGKQPDVLAIVYRKPDIFVRDRQALARLGLHRVARRLNGSRQGSIQFWLGTYHASGARYRRAMRHYIRALELGFRHPIIHYRMLEASLRLSGDQAAPRSALQQLVAYSAPFPLERRPIRHRVMHSALTNPITARPAAVLNQIWLRLRRRRQRTNR